MEKKIETCSICSDPYTGFRHNAWPINEGRCCEMCSITEVIPARLRRMFRRENIKKGLPGK
jgi:hypothetical protein